MTPKKVEEKEMPFLDHLEELRWRLLKSVISTWIFINDWNYSLKNVKVSSGYNFPFVVLVNLINQILFRSSPE